MTSSFLNAISAAGPICDYADRMQLYGWLVGRWKIDAIRHTDDGKTHHVKGDIWADWVLEGRAIQDLWSLPGFFRGTTLRVYDPDIDAWHIIWSDPISQSYTLQTGRSEGRTIVQRGTNQAGELLRWSFRDITEDAFRWRGERSVDGGKSWILQTEMSVNRCQDH